MDDTINRQDAIDALTDFISVDYPTREHARESAEMVMGQVPSAEQKTGEWVEEDEYGDLWVCDQCGFASEYRDNFCPNCGSRNVREDGEEE